MRYIKTLHACQDFTRSRNGGDYEETAVWDTACHRGEFRSSADFYMCPFCGRYDENCYCHLNGNIYQGPRPTRREMAAARRHDYANAGGWWLIEPPYRPMAYTTMTR